MARNSFKYNPTTFQFDPIYPSVRKFIKRSLIYLLLGFLTSTPAVYLYIQKYSSLQEQHLIRKNNQLTAKWKKLSGEIDLLYNDLETLAKKDDNYYRTFLDLEPLSQSVRQAGVGGTERELTSAKGYYLINSNYERLEKLKHQVDIAQQSFEQLNKVSDRRNTMLANRPAIQPISNKQLRTLHLTFGLRMHPIFKVWSDHKGLDFSAGFGTPVYATGDGRVSMSYYSNSYGNVVFVDHGFNYETRYAHLQKFIVEPGHYVKRGDIIGYVGNTGISVAPHLHYEVFYNGSAVNPIHFFQRDFSTSEYQKIIKKNSTSGTTTP